MSQTPGKIYLSDQRGRTETPQHRQDSTFNYGNYYDAHKEPFGPLYVFNEETLAAGQVMELLTEESTQVVILPVTGAVNFYGPQGDMTLVEAEEVLVCRLPVNSNCKIENPYASHPVSFIQIRIKGGTAATRLRSFEPAEMEGRLAEIVSPGTGAEALPFSLSIGRFAGRQEAFYSLKSPGAGFFAFVIAGAFECAGRLLHEKDGLALWDLETVDLEALSNNALILILELDDSSCQH
jgi:hypothetical protein